jgi:hypothetical protein
MPETPNLPALRPECSSGHGPMTLVDPRALSKDSNWCGTWYRCEHSFPACGNTVVLHSPALTAQHEEQAASHAARKKED